MNRSAASDKHYRSSSTTRQSRNKASSVSDITGYITDHAQLVRLRDMTLELNNRFEKPFRWIAARSWRGAEKHTYWQTIARGGHLRRKPQVRPRIIDFITIQSMLLIVRETEVACTAIAIELEEFLEKRAAADQTLVNIIVKSARRAKRRINANK